MAPRRDVVVAFVADTGRFDKGADQVSGRLRGVATGIQGIATLGAAVAGVSFFGSMIGEARDAERTGKQTEAVLRSTGGAANVTAKQIGDLAEKLSEKTAVDDEVIQHGENVLLTFKNIRNEAGRGNDVFNQTTQVALDMSAALSESGDASEGLQSNMIRVGKALNDPIAGISALTKVGVTFTDQQKAQIRSLVQQGDVMGAQKIILKELQSEFGGMAEASADSIGKAQVSWGNFAEEVGSRVMPAVNAVSDWALTTGLPALGQVAGVVGDVVTPAFRGLVAVGGDLVGVWQALPGPIQAGAVALGVWAVVGDRVTGFLGRGTGLLKGFGDEMRLQQGLASLAGQDIGRFGAGLAVLESRSPAISRMGEAFRSARGEAGGFAATVRGAAAASVSGLRTAVGGLIGALGGPWGLVVAGGAAVLGFFAQRSSQAADEQERLRNTARTVAQAIVEQAGATDKAVRAKAAEALSNVQLGGTQYDLLKLSEQLGISTSDLVSAYLGNADALQRVNQATAAYVNEDGSLKLNTEKGRTAWALVGALREVKGATDAEVESERRKKEAVEGATGVTHVATQAELDAIPPVDAHKEAIDGLINSLRTYWSESAAAVDGQIAWQQQWDDLSAAIQKNGTSLDINTQKGRDNATQLTSLIKTSQDMMLQDIQSGVAIDRASAKHVNRTNKLIAEAKRTGLNAREVSNLIAKYNGVPKNITTFMRQKGLGPVKQNLAWLTAIQTLLKDGIEATPDAITARMRKATGYTSSGREDYAGGRASGGLIRGPGSGTDDKAGVFRLSDYEFVQRAAATRYYGVSFMKALNEQRIPKEMLPGFATGGLVAPYPVDMSKTFVPSRAQVENAFFARHPELARVGRMKSWARAQAGKRYSWGAVGPGAYDCSGLVGNLYAIARGLPLYRRYFTTASMGVGRYGMAAGRGKVTVYLGPGHTAANIGGLHAEAYGGNGTPLAIGRVGTPLSYYTQTMHLTGPGMARGGLVKLRSSREARALSFLERGWPEPPKGFRNGGWLQPGGLAYNETNKPEAVFNQQQLAELKRPEVHKHFHLTMQVTNHPVDVKQQFAWMEAMAGPL